MYTGTSINRIIGRSEQFGPNVAPYFQLLLLLILFTVTCNIFSLRCYAVARSGDVVYDTGKKQFPSGNPEHPSADTLRMTHELQYCVNSPTYDR